MKRIAFASNKSSWDSVNCRNLPGSMADTFMAPICAHLPKGSWTVRRQPSDDPDTINVLSSAWGVYNHRPAGPTSVLLSHGCADKGIRARHAHRFDYTILPSPFYATTMGHGDPDRWPVLGYPKLDPIFNGQIAPLPRDQRARVLYAPTHGGGGEAQHWDDNVAPHLTAARRTTWWHRDQLLRRLNNTADFDVVFCPHPRYKPDHRSTLVEYVGADVVIADGGSTLWEALMLGIPLVVPAWLTAAANLRAKTLEARLYRERVGRHASSPAGFIAAVAEAADRGQTAQERQWGERVLPSALRGNAGKLHADFLLGLAGR